MKFTINKCLYLSIILFSFLFILGLSPLKVSASSGDNVFGYGWSDNVGWISFNNCKNPTVSSTCSSVGYGVTVDYANNNKVSGYAWSENVGWISFNPSDWGGCPPGVSSPCTSFLNKWASGNAGWARAMSVPQDTACLSSLNPPCNSGGWDGWISLNGTEFKKTDISGSIQGGYTFGGMPVYVIDSSKSSGFAWGSEVVGWVDLNHNSYNPDKGGLFSLDLNIQLQPSLTLTPKDLTWFDGKYLILAGNKVDLLLQTKNFTPTSCVRTGVNTFNDWDNNTSAGNLSDIHVKYDTNNITSIESTFNIQCTDGKIILSNFVKIKTIPLLKTNKCLDPQATNYGGTLPCTRPTLCKDLGADNYNEPLPCKKDLIVAVNNCQDPYAINYGGTLPCIPPTTCQDASAINYGGTLPCVPNMVNPPNPLICKDPYATNYKGSLPCIPPTTCQDQNATNYNKSLPCEYSSSTTSNLCKDPYATNYNKSLPCIPPTLCKDPFAVNYNKSLPCISSYDDVVS